MSFGTDGPNISRSRIPTRRREPEGSRCMARAKARFTVGASSQQGCVRIACRECVGRTSYGALADTALAARDCEDVGDVGDRPLLKRVASARDLGRGRGIASGKALCALCVSMASKEERRCEGTLTSGLSCLAGTEVVSGRRGRQRAGMRGQQREAVACVGEGHASATAARASSGSPALASPHSRPARPAARLSFHIHTRSPTLAHSAAMFSPSVLAALAVLVLANGQCTAFSPHPYPDFLQPFLPRRAPARTPSRQATYATASLLPRTYPRRYLLPFPPSSPTHVGPGTNSRQSTPASTLAVIISPPASSCALATRAPTAPPLMSWSPTRVATASRPPTA